MLQKDIEIFKTAILNEVEGYEFYKMAAYNSQDVEVKETLMMLANEELKHLEWLREAFNLLNTSDGSVHMEMIENPPSPGIFNWEKLQNQSTGLAISVFGIAIELERASVAFYKNAMEETPYESAKELFDVLAKWEEAHLNQFVKAYDQLTESWWADQGFSRF